MIGGKPASFIFFWMASLLGLASQFGCGQSSAEHSPQATVRPNEAISFTDVTEQSRLSAFRHKTGAFGAEWFPETMGSGGGFMDYDNDGWPDIIVVGGGVWPGKSNEHVPSVYLYRNNHNGTFTDITAKTGLARYTTYGIGLSVADYDNDGDSDIFVASLWHDQLFRNDGGHFTEVGERAGIARANEWSTSAMFIDADRDGWVDLLVGNYVTWSADHDLWCTMDGKTKSYCTPQAYMGTPPRFYHNNGDGTFSDYSVRAGFSHSPGKTLGVAELDFNDDGWPDLVLANDTEPSELYENRGDGTFEEKGVASGLAYDENGRTRAGMGIDAGDIDNSGEPSVFIGTFSNEVIGAYRHMGGGVFMDRAANMKMAQPSMKMLTFGLFLFDVNLDGYLDLFVSNGHIAAEVEGMQDGISYRQPAQLYLNDRSGRFTDVSAQIGGVFNKRLVARAAAYADYDQDGDEDVLLTENGGPLYLWRNDTRSGNFLRVLLRGVQSNRDGLGALVVAHVGSMRLERRVHTGGSFLAQSELTVTFGMGKAKRVDSLIVVWPSGKTDRIASLRANQEIAVWEGQDNIRSIGPCLGVLD